MQNSSIQTSKLLPALFEHIDEEDRITVLHIGPALSETIDFFCDYRCKLHFADLFAELPLVVEDGVEEDIDLAKRFAGLLEIPADARFDICLFWDLFNFLDTKAIDALLSVLRPHLTSRSLAHAFSVHNPRNHAYSSHLYSIRDLHTLALRDRSGTLPGYAPHSQRQMKEMLSCYTLERSVLLADSRLELLLHAKL